MVEKKVRVTDKGKLILNLKRWWIDTVKNQRGVTLVELLVVILIMGAIFVPISMMLNLFIEN